MAVTYRMRSASSKTWNNPLSTIVSKHLPSVSRRQRVEHLETGVDTPLGRLAASDLDRAERRRHRGRERRGEPQGSCARQYHSLHRGVNR